MSLSATNTTHRVHRRKSVNASASSTAQAAIAAALRENGDASAVPLPTHRRGAGSKKNSESHSMNIRPSMHSYFGPGGVADSVEQDTFEDMSMDEETGSNDKDTKNRNRRASEGSHLVKGNSKKSELRCDTCGKGYKHSSCLTKHMWEHDPAWAVTSKLLISKHQQVQLLEAASVLCNMNTETTAELPDMDVPHIDPSEASSASPLYSGSSEMQDEVSSVETTPPPMSDEYHVPDLKRYSAGSTGFSRSYRSAASSSFVDSVLSPALFPQRLSGVDFRPTTSGTDDGNLAAATAGLNFSGTPKTKPSLGNDIPPVPPLPEQYQSYSKSASLNNMHNPFHVQTPSLSHQLSDERNYYKADRDERPDQPQHEEEEGMFRMDQ
ncbi:hypothetical protein OHC33_000547 [Knufia fluminis]|uniref:C2H2-type domain-containing protein n=1 Tax=Knufia fluminis TaxID=191047 RepID=A0AAN8EM23_9EURO|nr:hypothetical protein OHC33_000547 [Knufia fluminis]